ncbi:MAG: hypothetical protein RL736_21 [Pseudomonadota bacterium]|jgi:hypothetical protein
MSNQIFYYSNSGTTSGQKFYIDHPNQRIVLEGLELRTNKALLAPNLLTINATQTISGDTKFLLRPNVNGSGVLLSGEASSAGANVFYTTGDQTISGIKTFTGTVNINSARFVNLPTINGTGVLLSGNKTIVYTTQDQTINGTKTFVSNTVLYSGVNVTFNKDANVVFSGTPTFNSGINSNILFNTQTSAFNFDSTMNGKMILVNSATPINATLPVGLQEGYNVSLTQVGAGKITIAATSPASRQQRLGLYSSAGQYAVISLINTGNNGFLLYGDLN